MGPGAAVQPDDAPDLGWGADTTGTRDDAPRDWTAFRENWLQTERERQDAVRGPEGHPEPVPRQYRDYRQHNATYDSGGPRPGPESYPAFMRNQPNRADAHAERSQAEPSGRPSGRGRNVPNRRTRGYRPYDPRVGDTIDPQQLPAFAQNWPCFRDFVVREPEGGAAPSEPGPAVPGPVLSQAERVGNLLNPSEPAVRPPRFRDWRQTPEGQQYQREREQRESAQQPASPRH
eukprot:943312-Alexandrium_andersonii.AAC.1